jgi:DNA-binding XRE family transcriptional regulator
MVARVGELKGIRHILGWTQEELAQILGVSHRALQSYEQGWRPLPCRVQQTLALLLYLHYRKTHGKPPACWTVLKCKPKERATCPAYQLRAGDVCWMIAGGQCHGEARKDPLKTMAICRKCPVMQTWWPVIPGLSAAER